MSFGNDWPKAYEVGFGIPGGASVHDTATIPQQPTEGAMSRLHGADVLRILRASLVPAHLCDGPTFLHEGALEAGETEIRTRWYESREAGCEHPPFEVGSSSGGGGAFSMPR